MEAATEDSEKYRIQREGSRIDDAINKINAENEKYRIQREGSLIGDAENEKYRIQRVGSRIGDSINEEEEKYRIKPLYHRALIQYALNDVSEEAEKPFDKAWFSYAIKNISDDETKHAKLLRYDESQKTWTPLPTQFTRCELGLCRFVSESPGTSYFAIVVEKPQAKSFIYILMRVLFLLALVFGVYSLNKMRKDEKKTPPPNMEMRIAGALFGLLLVVGALFTAFMAIITMGIISKISTGHAEFNMADFITIFFLSLAAFDFCIYWYAKKSGKEIMLGFGARDWLNGAIVGLIFAVLTHLYSIFL